MLIQRKKLVGNHNTVVIMASVRMLTPHPANIATSWDNVYSRSRRYLDIGKNPPHIRLRIYGAEPKYVAEETPCQPNDPPSFSRISHQTPQVGRRALRSACWAIQTDSASPRRWVASAAVVVPRFVGTP